MNSKSILEKIKNMNKKTIYSASLAFALAILGIGYMTFGKENSYAAVPKAEVPVQVSAVTIEPRSIDAVISVAGTLNSKNT